MLIEFGDQRPFIGGVFSDISGKSGTEPSIQTKFGKLNIGVTVGVTFIVNVLTVAHCPAFG